mgnify:FL=1
MMDCCIIIHFTVRSQDLCHDFIYELTALFGNTMFVVIMDNCRSHLNMESLLEQHKIKFLPAYSPFLNPIENCFNEIKCSIKRALSSQQELLHISSTVAKMETLKNIAKEAIKDLKIRSCADSCNHVMRYMSACLLKEDIYVM